MMQPEMHIVLVEKWLLRAPDTSPEKGGYYICNCVIMCLTCHVEHGETETEGPGGSFSGNIVGLQEGYKQNSIRSVDAKNDAVNATA